MKIYYREAKLSRDSWERLEMINDIIEEYQADGYKLTLRQLYYQLVSRDVIPNKDAEYKKLGKLLKEGRMCGFVDWDAIEDRLRVPSQRPSWESPIEVLQIAADTYERPRMQGQETYMEVWVEKDALSSVIRRATRPYHVPVMVNRGYSSASAMHDAFLRFSEHRFVDVLYLGDFDPSGLDMIRDIKERVEEFDPDFVFDVSPIALTRDQIDRYAPPPNPAKITDPRASHFVKEHGYTSWEVDALPPQDLVTILAAEIESRLDHEEFTEQLDQEREERAQLQKVVEEFGRG